MCILDEPFLASSLVFFTEVSKFMLCLIIFWGQKSFSITTLCTSVDQEVIKRPTETLMLGFTLFFE